jgi:hypothetical protein
MPQRHRLLRSSYVLAACLCASACAGEGRDAREPSSRRSRASVDDPFPAEAELEEIAARPTPAPEKLFGAKIAAADAWTLHGPGATETADHAYAGDDPNALALATVAAGEGKGRRVTAGMQCFAEEIGRFALVHGDSPALDIADFIAARCGTTVVRPMFTVRPDGLFPPDGLSLPRDRDGLATRVASLRAGAHLGVWMGREGERTVQVVAFGVPDVELEPVPLASGRLGWVELRGRVAWDIDQLIGRVTQGALGFATCEPQPGVAVTPPELALRCPVAPQDEAAVIELFATPRGRLLGKEVLRVIVSPRGVVPNAYRAPVLSLPVSEGEHDLTAVVTAVNALRHRAGLRPVSAAAEQTVVVEGLLPHLAAATADPSQTALADQIALGLMAGWRVEGNVRSGQFFFDGSHHGWSLERELAAKLSSPVARAKLFDPDAAAVAYATIDDEARGLRRSLVASYQLFSDRDYTPEIARSSTSSIASGPCRGSSRSCASRRRRTATSCSARPSGCAMESSIPTLRSTRS